MAKLAVLICSPNNPTTHCSSSLPSRANTGDSVPLPGDCPGEPGPTQGRWLDCRAPRSRASCSKVRGRNEPVDTNKVRTRSPDRNGVTHPRHRRRKPRQRCRRHTSPRSRACLSAWCLRRDSAESAVAHPRREEMREKWRKRPSANRGAWEPRNKHHRKQSEAGELAKRRGWRRANAESSGRIERAEAELPEIDR